MSEIHRLLLHCFDVGANRDADYLRLFDGNINLHALPYSLLFTLQARDDDVCETWRREKSSKITEEKLPTPSVKRFSQAYDITQRMRLYG